MPAERNCKLQTSDRMLRCKQLEVNVEFHMVHVPEVRDPLPEAHSYTPHRAANSTEAKKKKKILVF